MLPREVMPSRAAAAAGNGAYDLQLECTKDDPYPAGSTPSRPGHKRAKILSVRLNSDELDELNRYAETIDVPPSALVRGWILSQLHTGDNDSPSATVDRIAHELEQLRYQLAS